MSEEKIKIDGIPIQDYGTPNSRTCYSQNYSIMSEEEKEAIKNIEKELNKKYEAVPLYKDFSINSPYTISTKTYSDSDIRIALNLISSLQNNYDKLFQGYNERVQEILLKEKEIDRLQKELDKKDKVIDLMAEKLVEDSDIFNYQHSMTEEKWKQYFYNEVERSRERK